MLGSREKTIYGTKTLDDINAYIKDTFAGRDIRFTFFQSNHEGALIDCLHAAHLGDIDGVVLNAGALTHYSYALRDAIASIRPPTVEVHLSDIHAREPFRHVSVIKEVCAGQITGLGPDSYIKGVELLLERRDDA